MNREEPDISTPPPYFLSMLNSLLRNDNILLRTDLINTEVNNSCSEEFLNNLDEFTVDEEFIKKNLQCSICLEDFKIGDKCISLPCKTEETDVETEIDTLNKENHIFHSGCDNCSGIREWLKRNNSCPLCRKEFPKEQPINLVQPNISEENNQTQESIIINPNNLENTLTDMITSYINEIEENNEQRDIQLAIQASLNDS